MDRPALERLLAQVHGTPAFQTPVRVPVTLPRATKPRPKRADRARCGAKCRDGHACNAPAVYVGASPRNGRCRMHGGLSTGPRTPEGQARANAAARAAVLRRWERWRQA